MIIGLAGKKQSGKNTKSNFLHGYLMKKKDVIESFRQDEKGQLIVSALFQTPDGYEKGEGVLDLNNDTPGFLNYCEDKIWPYIKQYSFAGALKEVCSLFGIDPKLLDGDDDAKNTLTHLRWENMPGVVPTGIMFSAYNNGYNDLEQDFQSLGLIVHEPGQMTAREVMQFVGSDIFRKMHPTVWLDIVKKQIEEEKVPLAIITDVRFPHEVDWIRENGKTVCLLKNSDTKSTHNSEQITEYPHHDLIIDNRNMTIEESNKVFLDALQEWGIV